jgi:two-component system sensor histidine kinase/response regulator
MKFTDLGEVFLLVTKESATPLDVMLHFAITDTGIGIPLDRQKSVFEAFTQADGSTTRTYGGTGLGLTISSQLVQLMGGRVCVESEVGKGSVFHFTARFAVATASSIVEAVPDAVELSGVPVLVVDDNATNRRVLGAMLIGWRMVPTLAASAAQALDALRVAQESGRPFHLVLTDFQMPEADGFALATAIKKQRTGGARNLSKPIQPADLFELVERPHGLQGGLNPGPAASFVPSSSRWYHGFEKSKTGINSAPE